MGLSPQYARHHRYHLRLRGDHLHQHMGHVALEHACPDEGYRRIYLRKAKWFLMSMLAPELLMLFAGGQWAAAKRSVRDMTALGVHEWSMIHALHAESGGFVFQAGCGLRFPVTARQIHYLVQNRYVSPPRVSDRDIFDRSKADHFAKFIAGAQSCWFVVQIVARAAQRLDITLLELSTICLMSCTLAALVFWYHKPLDVRTPETLKSEQPMAKILVDAGDVAKSPYKDTPLDFCESIEYTSTQFPLNRLWGEQVRPVPRIPNDRDSLLHNWHTVIVIAIPTAAFGTLQLIAWDFLFPTIEEKQLWRWTCVSAGAILGLGCILEAGAIVASKFQLSGMQTFRSYKTQWPWCLFFWIAAVLYVLGRVLVIVEVVISLRALPPGVF